MNVALAIAAVLSGLFSIFLFSIPATPRTPRRILAVLFALVSAQFILTFIQMGGDTTGAAARPVVAMVMAPLLYLHLATAARPSGGLIWRDALHGLGPAVMFLVQAFTGGKYVDLLGSLGTGIYLVLVLVLTGGGSARFLVRGPQAALSLVRWRFVVVAVLATMLLADSVIALDMARRNELAESRPLLVSALIVSLALASGLVAVLHRAPPLRWIFEQARRTEPASGDAFKKLLVHMDLRRPWVQPDLTVARLGRQLGLPQRVVSAAVNEFAQQSFSRWVNGYRVRASMTILAEDPDRGLLDVMIDVGFQTKSNFNRAFREETGMTPSDWRRAANDPPV